jgi:hypothetical protein
MKALSILFPLGLAGFVLFATLFGAPAAPQATREPTAAAPLALSVSPTVAVTERLAAASLPTPPPAPTLVPRTLPTRTPIVRSEWSAPPTPTPEAPDRPGCDPAYPEERTCIPPGPPFDQGCAVTDERLFKVLPPDPQRLDHDNDGIGCEPMR